MLKNLSAVTTPPVVIEGETVTVLGDDGRKCDIVVTKVMKMILATYIFAGKQAYAWDVNLQSWYKMERD